MTTVFLCWIGGFVIGWLATGLLFFKSVNAPKSPYKGVFYSLLRLFFWHRLLAMQARDIRENKQLEAALKKKKLKSLS